MWYPEQLGSLRRCQDLAHCHQHQGATHVALGPQVFDLFDASHYLRGVGFQFDDAQQFAIQLRDLPVQRDTRRQVALKDRIQLLDLF